MTSRHYANTTFEVRAYAELRGSPSTRRGYGDQPIVHVGGDVYLGEFFTAGVSMTNFAHLARRAPLRWASWREHSAG
jgi:hypothetical protein